jgi:hypothetical protein
MLRLAFRKSSSSRIIKKRDNLEDCHWQGAITLFQGRDNGVLS